MTLDISRLSTPLSSLRDQSSTSPSSTDQGELFTSRETAQESHRVQLTPQAQTLQQITQDLKSIPDTDDNRVDAIRQAIIEGRYFVDSERVAEKLMAFEVNL